MGITIRIYEDQTGETRWQMIADNGKNIGNGSEGYVESRHAEETLDMIIHSIQTNDYKIVRDYE